MKNIKNMVRLGILSLALLIVGACADPLQVRQPHNKDSKGNGLVAIYIGESDSQMRTIRPGQDDIEGYQLTFSPEREAVDITEGNSAEFPLADGDWTITATAYKAGGVIGDSDDAVASGSISITLLGGAVIDGGVPNIILRPLVGNGTLHYAITVDDGAGGYLKLWETNGSPLGTFADNGVLELTDSASDDVSLAAGRYIAEVKLTDEDGNIAFRREVVEIWKDTVTAFVFAPSVFGDPDAVPANSEAKLSETDTVINGEAVGGGIGSGTSEQDPKTYVFNTDDADNVTIQLDFETDSLFVTYTWAHNTGDVPEAYSDEAALPVDFSTNNVLWIKAVSEDGNTTVYYRFVLMPEPEGFGDFTVSSTNMAGVSYTSPNLSISQSGMYYIGQTNTTTTDRIRVSGNDITVGIVLRDVNINVSGTGGATAFDSNVNNSTGVRVNLTLEGDNTLRSGTSSAGLRVPTNTTLTINGYGSLAAYGGSGSNGSSSSGGGGAGVGGSGSGNSRNDGDTSGTISITGATVTAIGGNGGGGRNGSSYTTGGGGGGGGGIGGGGGSGGYIAEGSDGGYGGTINITGTTVTATGGNGGAGGTVSGRYKSSNGGNGSSIGGGGGGGGGYGDGYGRTTTYGNGDGGSGGTVTITGVTATATGGIGGGNGGDSGYYGYGGYGGTISISDSTVTVTGGIGGGSGYYGYGGSGTLTVRDAVVLANSIQATLTEGTNVNNSIIFIGNDTGTMYGDNVTLTHDITFSDAIVLNIPTWKALTIPAGITLTNNGKIYAYGAVTGTVGANQPLVFLLSLDDILPAPQRDAAPVTIVNTEGYSGTVVWRTQAGAAVTGNFAPNTVYRASLILTAKTGFSFDYVGENAFTYTGADVTYAAGSRTVAIMFGASLAVPTVTSVTAGNAGELIVRWDAVSGANTYDIYYSLTDNTESAVKISSVSSPYRITGLIGATAYHVWVVARNATVESGFSESVSGTTASFPRSPSITINLFPQAENILPQSVTVSANSAIALSADDTYTAYQWYVDGEAVSAPAGTGATYNFIGIGKTFGAVYEVALIATSSNGTNYFGRCRVNINNNPTPVAGDYTFDLMEQTAGDVTEVAITANSGKSTGVIGNIRYNNNTAIPQTGGIYAVTFDVAAGTGWNAAYGLSAGNLIVTPFPTPVASDYTFGNMVQGSGSVTEVTITANSGASTGAVSNIRYNNSTTIPQTAGTYPVTFDVAAATGWNVASGLSAGELVVVTAVPTPVASDYTFSNMNQIPGSVTAVTITAKPGASPGAISNIRYNNSTTIPQTDGVYAVTFNVAAAIGWNAATGLSAGNLTISEPPPDWVTGTPVPLTANQWANGSITTASGVNWYAINVSAGTTYRIWWNDKDQGNGTKTGDVVVGVRHEDGTFYFGGSGTSFSNSSVDSGYTTAQSFTPTVSGTVYLRVTPYNQISSYTGTYGIVYSTGSTRPAVN